jgi:hypothetical protein
MISPFETNIQQKDPITKIHPGTRYSGSLYTLRIADILLPGLKSATASNNIRYLEGEICLLFLEVRVLSIR